eukprot:734541-Pelagomonas_calceolata.AAC.1
MGEWQVQRSRRKPKASSSGSQSHSKHLSTPVIPSGAFAALAPADEPRLKTEEERERERKKKRAARQKKKRSNQVMTLHAGMTKFKLLYMIRPSPQKTHASRTLPSMQASQARASCHPLIFKLRRIADDCCHAIMSNSVRYTL